MQLRPALCPFALGLEVKRPLQQHLRLACGEPRGECVKLRGLGGEQLLDVAGKPDLERPQVAVDQQAMLALIV